jgi:hypothetical protein
MKTIISNNIFLHLLVLITFLISNNNFPNCTLNFFPYFLILITFLISKYNFSYFLFLITLLRDFSTILIFFPYFLFLISFCIS